MAEAMEKPGEDGSGDRGVGLFRLLTKHKLVYRDASNWRMTKRIPGQINGLPHSGGVLVATNGIVCLIEQTGGDTIYEGHMGWFVPDAGADEEEVELLKAEKYRKAKKPINVEDYLDLLNL